MIKLRVPRYIQDDCLDPRGTEVPRELGLPTPHLTRDAATYTISEEMRRETIQAIREQAEGRTYGVDPETSRRAKWILRWCEKEEAK